MSQVFQAFYSKLKEKVAERASALRLSFRNVFLVIKDVLVLS